MKRRQQHFLRGNLVGHVHSHRDRGDEPSQDAGKQKAGGTEPGRSHQSQQHTVATHKNTEEKQTEDGLVQKYITKPCADHCPGIAGKHAGMRSQIIAV